MPNNQPKWSVPTNTEKIMRTKVKESQRLRYAQMNRMHTSNFLFNVFHIKVILIASSGSPQTRPCMSLVGTSMSEPHINGTAVRELYILWYVGHAKYMPSMALWI